MYVAACLPFALCPLTGRVGDRCPRGVGGVRSYLGLVPPPTASSGRTNDRHQGGYQYRIHHGCLQHGPRFFVRLHLLPECTLLLTLTQRTPTCRAAVSRLLLFSLLAKGQLLTSPLIYPCITLMQGLRHPSVEAARGSSMFIPNDVDLRDDRRLAIVTGNTYSNANIYV